MTSEELSLLATGLKQVADGLRLVEKAFAGGEPTKPRPRLWRPIRPRRRKATARKRRANAGAVTQALSRAARKPVVVESEVRPA